jgi:UDP-GlcNAc3NAcA epimerase
MKIVTIVGARPQFIKAAMVSHHLQKAGIEEVIIHTGQHFDDNMSHIFFSEMMIPKPKYNLQISNLSHGAMTGRMLEGIETILIEESPSFVMVFGDTNSTLAGALAAKKLNIKVIHVEAGLRSYNMKMPEEINRIITDRISSLLFCPTDVALHNLKLEGFDNFDATIVKCGDVMQDAALFYSKISKKKSQIIRTLGLNDRNFVLATIHRQENTDSASRLRNIFNALGKINKTHDVVVPLHPRTKEALNKNKIDIKINAIDPVGYFDMIELIKNCDLVMTDSGGLQKEAFFFKKNCVTIREETEWTELVEHGFNTLAEATEKSIKRAFEEMSNKYSNFDMDLYGKGKAAEKILLTLQKFL